MPSGNASYSALVSFITSPRDCGRAGHPLDFTPLILSVIKIITKFACIG
ncbi:hypothetical protein [Escherichia phage Ioannina]|nr:hypothetical protein [Escherichia phage Ioannina]